MYINIVIQKVSTSYVIILDTNEGYRCDNCDMMKLTHHNRLPYFRNVCLKQLEMSQTFYEGQKLLSSFRDIILLIDLYPHFSLMRVIASIVINF